MVIIQEIIDFCDKTRTDLPLTEEDLLKVLKRMVNTGIMTEEEVQSLKKADAVKTFRISV